MPRRRTRAEEDAAFGKAIKRRMGQMKMGGKALAGRWNYPEYYVKMIIDDGWLPLDVEIAEICEILEIRKRWKGRDVL